MSTVGLEETIFDLSPFFLVLVVTILRFSSLGRRLKSPMIPYTVYLVIALTLFLLNLKRISFYCESRGHLSEGTSGLIPSDYIVCPGVAATYTYILVFLACFVSICFFVFVQKRTPQLQ